MRAAQAAAPAFKVSPDLTPSALVAAVADSLYGWLLDQLNRRYKNLSPKQKEQLYATLDEAIRNMNAEDRRKLQDGLRLDKLTGKTLMKALTATTGVVAVTTLISSAGFGAYVALTTIMHAVMTTLHGSTLPFAAYTTATTVLSFLIGPLGVSLLVLLALSVTGRKGQKTLTTLSWLTLSRLVI